VVLRTLENPDRSQALELGPSTLPGAVTQFFPTIANQKYKVEIFACSLEHGRQGNTQAQIDVADLKKTFDCPEGEIPRAVNFEFTARHTFTTITLRGIGDAAYGPMIEKIVINPIPPSNTP